MNVPVIVLGLFHYRVIENRGLQTHKGLATTKARIYSYLSN